MRVSITFKDPDAVDDQLRDAVRTELATIEGLTSDERELLLDSRIETVKDAGIRRWIDGGEYVTIEIDTDLGTATVIPVTR